MKYLNNIDVYLNVFRIKLANTGYYLCATLFGMLISFCINPFMALNLTYNDYAIIGYYGSFNSLLMPLISFSLVTFYAKNYFLMEESKRIKVRNTLIIALLLLSFLLSTISFACLYLYFYYNSIKIKFYPFAILSIYSNLFVSFYSFVLIDLKLSCNAKKYFKLSILYSIVAALLSITFVIYLKLGALGSMGAAFLVSVFFAVLSIKTLFTKWEFDFKVFLSAIDFCWPLSVAAMLNYFFMGIDRALLEPLGDNHKLGLYNVAIQITNYLVVFNNAIGDTFQPDILRSIGENNERKTYYLVGGIFLLNVVPIFIFILIAPYIIKLLTFDRFTDAATFAKILAFKNITTSLYFSLSTIMIGYGLSKMTLVNKILGTILSFVMFKYLIFNYGYLGAAWGQVFSFLILSTISILCLIYYKFRIVKDYEYSKSNTTDSF